MASHSSPGSICPVRSGWTSSTRCRGCECRLFNSVWDLGSALSHHSLVRKQFSIYPKCSSLTIAGQRSCSSSSWETWPRNQQRKSCRSTTYKVRMPSNKWDKKKNNCLRVTDHIPVFIIRFSVQTDWIQTKQIKQSFRLILTEWKSCWQKAAFTLSSVGGIRI